MNSSNNMNMVQVPMQNQNNQYQNLPTSKTPVQNKMFPSPIRNQGNGLSINKNMGNQMDMSIYGQYQPQINPQINPSQAEMGTIQMIPQQQTNETNLAISQGSWSNGCMVNSTLDNIQYTPGFLQSQIGQKVKVEFLIGTSMLIDREGILVSVGTSYIIIQETATDDLLLCDMYSIKFVKIFY